MSEIQLRVAIWGGKTSSGKLFGDQKLDLAQRLDALAAVLEKARPWLDEAGDSPSVLKVFLAPEYLLIKSSMDANEERAVSFEDFQLLAAEGRLKDLSQGLLLIPGTVIWKKPALKESGSDTQEPALDRLAKIQQSTQYKERIENADKVQRGFVSFIAKNEVKAFEEKIGKLAPLDRSSVFIARNAAYVYYRGDMLLKYYKQSEYRGKKTFELSRGDKDLHSKAIKFVRGYKEGVFQVPLTSETHVRCGVEICADHAGQQLKNSSARGTLHLHFILSDQISNLEKSVAVGPGGYVIHASTSSSSSGVFDHALNRAPEAAGEDLTYGRLTCYAQTLTV